MSLLGKLFFGAFAVALLALGTWCAQHGWRAGIIKRRIRTNKYSKREATGTEAVWVGVFYLVASSVWLLSGLIIIGALLGLWSARH